MSAFRKELSALLALALPILGTQLAQTGNAFVDTVMAGRVGAVDLAAVAVGASAWVPIYLFMTGVLMAGTPVLSRHVGAGEWARVNPIAQQLLYLSLLLGVAGFFLLRHLDPLFHAMDVDPELLPKVSNYLRALSWGMPGAALVIALRAYTEALSNPRPVLLISIAGLLLNIPANYIFIYGKLGFPAMGGVGCGWATTLVFWFMAAALGLYIASHKSYAKARLNLKQRFFEPGTIAYLSRLGLPVGLSIFFEISIFTVIALLISQLGAEVVAGHQIALNFTGLLFMVPLSFALAATVRVGLARGQGDPAAIHLAVSTVMKVTMVIGVLAALGLLAARSWIPRIYTDNEVIIVLTTQLLLFAAIYQVSDALQVAAAGCLRGFEDTTIPMVMTLLAYWGVGLPLGYVLGLTDLLRPAMGPAGFWIGLVAGLTVAALLLLIRLRNQWHHHGPAYTAASGGHITVSAKNND
ncbi:MAG: MATE family multidrug resistance protein [Bermanella sp.]